MINTILLIILINLPGFTIKQSDYVLLQNLEEKSDVFASDPLGNIYLTNGSRIRKYNNRLEKIADYSNSFLGNIYSVDVSDPLRILLYYREFNQVLWLDNYLTAIRSPVRLDDLGSDQAGLVCSSAQGGFWIYNNLNKKIQYFDVHLQLIHESIPLNTLIGDKQPVYMVEKSRTLYLYAPSSGILLFDQFGTYNKILPLFPENIFQVSDENLFFMNENEYVKYNLNDYKLSQINLPDTSSIISVQIQPGFLYIQKKNGIYVYKE